MCCGKEEIDKWMHPVFTGKYGTIWYCHECFINGNDKLSDINYKKKIKKSQNDK